MRYLAFTAAMVCALAVLPARAQRGGARMGGAPARSFGAMHVAPGPSRGMSMSPRGQSWNSFQSGGFHSCAGCFHHQHHHGSFVWWNRGFGSPFYGYGLGYSYYPSLWDSSSSYGQQDSSDESERYLTRQIDELNQEVQRLRQEQEERTYQPAQVRPQENTPPPEAARTPAQSRKDLPTILVFRDQHIQEVQNYAIAGKDLVVVADRRATKIPLEKLDLAATAKLNDERGIDFQLPR